jgi:hypothetical protein
MKNIYKVILGILLISSFSCNKQDWDKEVNLSIRIESDMNEEIKVNNNDVFNVNQAKLTISSITISGKRLQSDDVTINYTQTLNLDFLNPEALNNTINIPVGTYEELTATLTFSTAANMSFIKGDVSSNNGQGQGGNPKVMNILLSFNQLEKISIINEQSESVVLIDENTKELNISASIQKSFNEINSSMWQGLMNANQNQSQVDLTSLVGNQFQSSMNSNIKSSIKLKVLK